MSPRTVGVEEELMLVDPETCLLIAVSERAVRANQADAEVEHELFLHQIETSTTPCTTADDLFRGIRDGRHAVVGAAAAVSARAVAMATPVLRADDGAFTPKSRYRTIQSEYGELARQSLVCGMHMHVDISDDEEGVRVIDGIRPWLPLLVALSANSPYWQGRDTGHASWRSQVWGRWPTAGAAEPFGDPATYRAVSDRLISWGAGIDTAMLYFDVRLSEKYPTVEIRVADVCTDIEDAVLVALLARALVETHAASPGPVTWRSDLLRASGWRAARFGLSADLVHPLHETLVPAREVFDATVAHVRPWLEASDDLDRVTDSFERLMARGNGATHQRRMLEKSGDLRAVVEDLARRTEESWGTSP